MIVVLLASLAFGHGGEDHGAPASPGTASGGEVLRLPTWSSEFDAVLVVPHPHPGQEVDARLLLADFGTSAPIGDGTVELKLDGAGSIHSALMPSSPVGTWPVKLVFPAVGLYTGGLTVIADDRADVLGLPEFEVTEHVEASGHGFAWGAMIGGGLCGAFGGLAFGFALGLGGRRARAAVVTGAIAMAIASDQVVQAHGGEDHGAPAAPAIVGGGLFLPLDSQFLLEVRTARAHTNAFEERVRALGTTVAPPGRHAEIHAPVTGVVSIPDVATLTPGAAVEAGQVLATIAETFGGADRSSVVDARTGAQVRLAQAKSALAIARRDQEQALALGDLISGKDRVARAQAVTVGEEEVRQAEIAARGVTGASSTVVVKSPIYGRIAAMMARPGDLVLPGDPLYHVVGEGGLWVEARVPQTLAGHLQSGALAMVETDARPGVQIPARVLDPGLEADPATGTLVITLALDEAVAGLVPGMSVTASIVAGAPRQALTIPDAAVVDSGGESLVFVKTGPENFEARSVRLGARSADQREILEGIAAGERVVVAGTYPLRSLAGR